MLTLDEALGLIPDCDLDLSGCDAILAHGLPPPVVISLARRPDRWQAAVANLAPAGITRLIKADAVDGKALQADVFQRLLADPGSVDRPSTDYLQLLRPSVGCFLSHLRIWKRFLASGGRHVLILEDDARPARDYSPERAKGLLAGMPADADILLLGATIMDGLAAPTLNPAFRRVYYYNGTYGYLLTRKGCLSLLPRMLPLKTHIDNQISMQLVRAREELRVFCVEPRLFEHDFGVYSDVYHPVEDTARADAILDAVFKDARLRLEAEGVDLFPPYVPPEKGS